MGKPSTTRTGEELVRQWMREAWNERREEAIEDCYDPDFIGVDRDETLRGHAGVRTFFHAIHGGCGDLSVRVDDVLTEGDCVAARITAQGLHNGELVGYEASGAALTFAALICFQVRGGRFLRTWQYWDVAGVLRSIRVATGGELTGLPPSTQGGDLGPAPPTRSDVGREEIERNKEAVRSWLEQAWNQQRIDVIDELIGEDFCFNDALAVIRGRADMRAWVEGMHGALPDIALRVDDLIAEGDKVACRLSFEAVHGGDLFGVAPTGRKIRSGAIFIVRMADGQFREAWQVWDLFAVLQQVGAV